MLVCVVSSMLVLSMSPVSTSVMSVSVCDCRQWRQSCRRCHQNVNFSFRFNKTVLNRLTVVKNWLHTFLAGWVAPAPSLSLTHTHTHTHSDSLSLLAHIIAFSLSLSLYFPKSHTISHILTHSLFISLARTHNFLHTYTFSLYLSYTHSFSFSFTHTISPFLSRTHTISLLLAHTHTHTHFCSHTHTQTHCVFISLPHISFLTLFFVEQLFLIGPLWSFFQILYKNLQLFSFFHKTNIAFVKEQSWRPDTQHNNIRNNDTQRNSTRLNDTRHNEVNCDTQHFLKVMHIFTFYTVMLCVIMLNAIMLNVTAP